MSKQQMSQQQNQPSVIRLLNSAAWGRKLLATTTMTMAAFLATTSSAYAVGLTETPTGGVVVGGSSAITYGTGSMTVDQSTDRSVINWDTYNIGQDASATYNMPGSTSLSVNRVVGQDPSQILGTLKSNGRIMILDPNGVFFSKTATVDVGRDAAPLARAARRRRADGRRGGIAAPERTGPLRGERLARRRHVLASLRLRD